MRVGSCRLPPSYIVIIAEKPKAGRKIAEALGYGRVRECRAWGIPFWLLWIDSTLYVVAPAAGHLFGLTTDEHGFPVFSYYWAPLWQVEESAKYTRKFYELLRVILRGARLAINACDYDIEGSVIGYMIIRAFFDVKRAKRMKFSALTPYDIRRAFQRLEPLDWEMIEAGLARHELDWVWGINVSRALMEAVRRVTGRRVTLSAGRVQSPTLMEAVRRDRERNLHLPLPRFAVEAVLLVDGKRVKARLAVLDMRSEAETLASRLRRRGYLEVLSVQKKLVRLPPPPPFNLGDLQAEAARIYGYSPMKTQDIAEKLYLEALISYPRTNSQKIPPTVNVRSILEGLRRIPDYSRMASRLLAQVPAPRPRQGSKDDPAHPAIHPTGEVPRGLSRDEVRIYDLIVRRFLASMMPSATVATVTVIAGAPELNVRVTLTGVTIVEKGWLEAYPFAAPSERRLPVLRKGDRLHITSLVLRVEYTKPPEPYTKASLVKWMEGVGIGTESTRARIVELLFERGYLRQRKGGRGVEVTDLGYAVAELLASYFPELTSVKLTHYFEEMLEAIRMGRVSRERVLSEAKSYLTKLLTRFRESFIDEAGVVLATSLGLVKPREACRICGRTAYRAGMCRFHYEAYERVRKGYGEWARRLGGIGFREYLRRLASRREAGKWVKEVASYLLTSSETSMLR